MTDVQATQAILENTDSIEVTENPVKIDPISFTFSPNQKPISIDKLTAKHVGTVQKIAVSSIKRVSNVREPKDERNQELIDHIKVHGIQQPLHVTLEGKLADGYCRLVSAEELNIEYAPALIIDLAEEDIPQYQVSTTIRTNLKDNERYRAICQHLLLNPSDSVEEVAA
ncbi:hypothetical protein DAPPUDRAFT_339127, partial [Daphnia pulex]